MQVAHSSVSEQRDETIVILHGMDGRVGKSHASEFRQILIVILASKISEIFNGRIFGKGICTYQTVRKCHRCTGNLED